MSINAAKVTVLSTPTQVAPPDPDWTDVRIRNTSGSVTVYLGPGTVTSSTGFELRSGEIIELDINGPEAVYGVTAAGSADVEVLRLQVG